MKRKITSVLITLLIVGANAAPLITPLITVDNCDISCCQDESMVCMMAQMEPCEYNVTVCDASLIVPLVVASVNSITIKKFENIEYFYDDKAIDVIVDNYLWLPDTWSKSSDPPPSHLTPLLI